MASEQGVKLALRVKSKKSQNAVLRDLYSKETVSAMLEKLSTLTGVPAQQIALLKGFPPQRVELDKSNLVETLGLQNQDTIIVEEVNIENGAGVENTATTQNVAPEPASRGPALEELIPEGDTSGLLLRQVVPSDNSCLFTSVTYCLSGQVQEDPVGGSTFLREMIANTVASDPGRFNEAMLGRPNSEYVEWIKKTDSWGGGIELSILAEFYGMQICVVDTQSLHISNFGEDHNYPQSIFLIYDGIHYDPLYYEPFNGGASRTIFETNDANILELAMQIAREAKASHQFTDTKNFSLRCQICNTLLRGETEAQQHAKQTTHTAFAEITGN